MTIDPLAHFLSSIPPRLAREEEGALSRRYQAGDIDAGKTLVSACLPLAVSYANRWLTPGGMDLDDLIGAACLGLCESLARYDPGRGTAFSTYSRYLMMREVVEAVSNDHPVKYSSSRSGPDRRIMYNLAKTQDKLAAALGREPTMAEVAEALEVDEGRLRTHLASRSVARLDAPIGEDGENTLVSIMPSIGECPETSAILEDSAQKTRESLAMFVDGLDPIDRRIWHLRTAAEEPVSRPKIAADLGMSHQAVEQRENRILKNLKEYIKQKKEEP